MPGEFYLPLWARAIEGKRISSENVQRHGLASSSGVSLDFEMPALATLVEEARTLGFSVSEAVEFVTPLAVAREVIDAKHASFKEEPEAERSLNMSPEVLYRTIKEMDTPRSGVTSAERLAVFTLLYRQIKKKITIGYCGSHKSSRVTESSCAASNVRSIKSAKLPGSKNKKTNPKGWIVSGW